MKTTQIFKELETHLTMLDISMLRMNIAVPGDIGMCLTISDIVHSYNSTRENDKRVAYLLSSLCKNHFKIVRV